MKASLVSLLTLLYLMQADGATTIPTPEAIGLLAPADATGIQVDQQPEMQRSQLMFAALRSWDQSAINEQSLNDVLGIGWRSCPSPPAVWEDFGEKHGDRVMRVRQRLRYYSAETALLLVGERVEDASVSAATKSPHEVIVRVVLQTFWNRSDLAQLLSSLQVTCQPKI